ncbi:MAG: hypothetical protein R3C24_14050 [Cyanobacteriota/Melainabacteria group bacterium]
MLAATVGSKKLFIEPMPFGLTSITSALAWVTTSSTVSPRIFCLVEE